MAGADQRHPDRRAHRPVEGAERVRGDAAEQRPRLGASPGPRQDGRRRRGRQAEAQQPDRVARRVEDRAREVVVVEDVERSRGRCEDPPPGRAVVARGRRRSPRASGAARRRSRRRADGRGRPRASATRGRGARARASAGTASPPPSGGRPSRRRARGPARSARRCACRPRSSARPRAPSPRPPRGRARRRRRARWGPSRRPSPGSRRAGRDPAGPPSRHLDREVPGLLEPWPPVAHVGHLHEALLDEARRGVIDAVALALDMRAAGTRARRRGPRRARSGTAPAPLRAAAGGGSGRRRSSSR